MWTLNEELLCDRIDYFRAAFRGGGSGFKEGIEKSIHLVEDDPAAFKILVDWLHEEKISSPGCGPFQSRPSSTKLASNKKPTLETRLDNQILWEVTKAYVLADKLGCGLLGVAIMKFLFKPERDPPFGLLSTPELLQFVFDNTSTDSDLRKVVITFAMWCFFNMKDCDFSIIALKSDRLEFNQGYLKALEEHIIGENCDFLCCKVHNLEKFKEIHGKEGGS